MTETEAVVREWGRSLGIVIPKEAAEKENLKPGEKVTVIILKKSNVLKETFGALKGKFKKPTSQIMKEIDEELWGE
ncbi:MAG: AbrB/MazE/SpoVT family DNA-binding domain-containing protein [Nanoarchaeota archaeon]